MHYAASRFSSSLHKQVGATNCLVLIQALYKDPYDGPEHRLFRHIAYKPLARWCWSILVNFQIFSIND